MILTRNMFIYFSCYFDIDEGHSDHFKWCIVQTEASPGKPDSYVKTRSEMGYRFSVSGLKRGLKSNIFWSEIGNRAAHPHPKFWGVPPRLTRDRTKLGQTQNKTKTKQTTGNSKPTLV